MFLKSIELFGFKSFADRTKIEFSDGISALLGPNGCGKSNVVDAIKWVLGEQAVRSLRAERMEDVIFNGTETRKALNVAEVSLVFSNEANILEIEASEIAIRRRLFRNGESEFTVNGAPVKLKELRELFYDTGIGKSAYSIMEQGKIDQVLSNKPEDRRLIFEEAAGITKYKIRGQEAERKLDQTEENIRQVETIVVEIKRKYDSLKIQADKTVRYRELREQIFLVEKSISLLRLRDYLENRDKLQAQLDAKKQEKDSLTSQLDTLNESQEQHLGMMNSMESEIKEQQRALSKIEMEKNNLSTHERFIAEQVGEIEGRIAAAQGKETEILKRIEGIEKEKARKNESISELERFLSDIDKNIDEYQLAFQNALERVGANKLEIQHKEQNITALEAAIESSQSELREITDRLVLELDAKLKESGYSSTRRRELQERLLGAIKSLRIQINAKKSTFTEAQALSKGALDTNRLPEITAILEELSGKIEMLEADYSAFANTLPDFLDDFLAPEGIISQKRSVEEKITNSHASIRLLREEISRLIAENDRLAVQIEEYRKTLNELRLNQVRLKTQIQGVLDSIKTLDKERAENQKFLSDVRIELGQYHHKLSELAEKRDKLAKRREELLLAERVTQDALMALENTVSQKNQEMMQREQQNKSLLGKLGTVQVEVEKSREQLASVQTEIRNVYDYFKEKHSRDLAEFEPEMYEIARPIAQFREDLSTFREELRKVGQVNLMAPEEFKEEKERYDFYTGQIDDLKRARADLAKVTDGIRKESAARFLETYDKIKKNFHSLFRRLFGGGRAELRLDNDQDVLDSGIEIFAQPPGKKLENIALLSGGERSMTAVALLFATYMVKPSPFCILDEIDAALDEANVERFVHLLGDFGNTSQFVVITHNKKTVLGAKTLLGVTMQESGVSKAIAIRLDGVHAQESG